MSTPAPYDGSLPDDGTTTPMAEPGIVTPEAVVLSFETAGVGSRLIAQVIDLAIQSAAGLLIAGGAAGLGATSIGLAGVYFGLFLVAFGYPIASETLWRGRTVGKAVMGLRVVTVEGAPIRFRHALVRGALGLLDFWATGGGAAVLCILATRRNQRLGDLVAGTLVVRERTAAHALAAVTFWVPQGWEPYAAGPAFAHHRGLAGRGLLDQHRGHPRWI